MDWRRRLSRSLHRPRRFVDIFHLVFIGVGELLGVQGVVILAGKKVNVNQVRIRDVQFFADQFSPDEPYLRRTGTQNRHFVVYSQIKSIINLSFTRFI